MMIQIFSNKKEETKMVKCESIGMIQVAKVNPVLTKNTDVENYSFITVDGDLYVVMNELTGDKAGANGATIKAGEFLNGYLVKAWDSQKLVVDEEHIKYAENKSYADIVAGTTLMGVDATSGKLEVISQAPTSGIYFKVTDKVSLCGKAVKVKVIVVDETAAE